MSAGAFGVTGGGVAENGCIFRDTLRVWEKFGLSRSPFNDSATSFFSVPGNNELYPKLKRFRASNDCLFVLSSILGSGVTTSIKKIVEDQDDPARIHYIEATPDLGLDKIIISLSNKFVEFKNISREFPHLLHQLEVLNNEVGAQLLVIDDAHHLSKETLLGLLLVLAQQDLNATQFRVVLCGDPQLEDQVESLLNELELAIPRQKFSLSPCTLDETYDYLEHRFQQAGLNDKMPFTSAMIKQIHRLSGGFPGRINRVAQQVLIDSHKDERSFMDTKSDIITWFQERKMRLLSITLLTCALCGLWWMQDRGIVSDMVAFTRARIIPKPPTAVASNSHEQDQATQTPVVAQNQRTPTEAARVLMDAISAAMPSEANDNEDKIAASELKHLSYIGHNRQSNGNKAPYAENRPEPKPHKRVDVKPAVIASLETPKAEAPLTTAVKPASDNAVQAKPAKPNALVVAKNVNVTPPTKVALNDIRDAEHDLMHLEGYTLQIMGTYKPEYIADYIKKQHLKFDDVAYFETKNKDKPWFVLVYGQFDNVAEAKAAIASLPKGIQSQHPWIKPLNDVHSAIKIHG